MENCMMTVVRLLGGGVELWLRTAVRSSQSDVLVCTAILINLIPTTSILSRSNSKQAATDWDRCWHGAQKSDLGGCWRIGGQEGSPSKGIRKMLWNSA